MFLWRKKHIYQYIMLFTQPFSVKCSHQCYSTFWWTGWTWFYWAHKIFQASQVPTWPQMPHVCQHCFFLKRMTERGILWIKTLPVSVKQYVFSHVFIIEVYRYKIQRKKKGKKPSLNFLAESTYWRWKICFLLLFLSKIIHLNIIYYNSMWHKVKCQINK